MSKVVWFKGKEIIFYDCKDCKLVMEGVRDYTNRPNGKFCCSICKEYVDSKENPND